MKTHELDLPPSLPTTDHSPVAARPPAPKPRPRLVTPNRSQIEWRSVDLDGTLAQDHRARIVWAYVLGVDMTLVLDKIVAVEGAGGRSSTDPSVLLALWLFATLEGVGAGRAINRLCQRDDAYRWICGGVPTNYRTICDFRTDHADLLDQMLTDGVAVLMAEGLVTLERIAQDGVRVRASAGAASFRRVPTLEESLEQAKEQVEGLRGEVGGDPAASSRRQQAARERAARERQERVEAALENAKKLREIKPEKEKDKARASTTDPEARVMKRGDGGFRPAFNGQFATDTASQIIVGVDASNEGTDLGQMEPMAEQVEERFAKRPAEHLVDGGYTKHADFDKAAAAGTTVYAPVPKPRKPKDETKAERNPHDPLPTDSQAVADWRKRMATVEAKEIYKQRAATAECVNALARNRGLRQFLVRGLAKVRAVMLWMALAHNLMRAVSLRAAVAAAA
jgi:transposase